MIRLCIIFDLYRNSVLEAPGSCKYITIIIVYFQCCFCTCCSIGFCAWDAIKQAIFCLILLLVCRLFLKLLLALDLCCYVCLVICWSFLVWQALLSSYSLSLSSIPNNAGLFPGATEKLHWFMMLVLINYPYSDYPICGMNELLHACKNFFCIQTCLAQYCLCMERTFCTFWWAWDTINTCNIIGQLHHHCHCQHLCTAVFAASLMGTTSYVACILAHFPNKCISSNLDICHIYFSMSSVSVSHSICMSLSHYGCIIYLSMPICKSCSLHIFCSQSVAVCLSVCLSLSIYLLDNVIILHYTTIM